MTNPIPTNNRLLTDVRHLIDAARQRVASAVNAEQVKPCVLLPLKKRLK